MKRILVTGSRDWRDINAVRTALAEAVGDDDRAVIVHGGCGSGADVYAAQFAKHRCWREEIHHADWHRFGAYAGPLRNADMVRSGADICLAFIRNNSRGASGCARLAEEAGIPVRYFREGDDA